MRIPRSLSGQALVHALRRLGYEAGRQRGSHVHLRHPKGFRLTVPLHNPLKVGTLRHILREVERQQDMSTNELLRRLDL